jgi:hypothetical protein
MAAAITAPKMMALLSSGLSSTRSVGSTAHTLLLPSMSRVTPVFRVRGPLFSAAVVRISERMSAAEVGSPVGSSPPVGGASGTRVILKQARRAATGRGVVREVDEKAGRAASGRPMGAALTKPAGTVGVCVKGILALAAGSTCVAAVSDKSVRAKPSVFPRD